MSRKLAFCLVALVLIPLGLMAWLGIKVSVEDEARVRQQVRDVLLGRLRDTQGQIHRVMEGVERELLKAYDSWETRSKELAKKRARKQRSNTLNRWSHRNSNIGVSLPKKIWRQQGAWHQERRFRLQKLQGKQPLIRQVFLLNAAGQVLYPNRRSAAKASEELAFLRRTQDLWKRKALWVRRPKNKATQTKNKQSPTTPQQRQTSTPNRKLRPGSQNRRIFAHRGYGRRGYGQRKYLRRNRRSYGSLGDLFNRSSIPQQRKSAQQRPQRPQQRQSAPQRLQRPQQRLQRPQQRAQRPQQRAPAPQSSGSWGPSQLLRAQGRSMLNNPARQAVDNNGGSEQTHRQTQGWIAWYWAEGLHLLFWKRLSSGEVVGAEIDRIVLMSQLIGALPDTSSGSRRQQGLMKLIDEKRATVYQWGPYAVAKGEKALAQLELSNPLQSWRLVYYGPERKQFAALTGKIRLQLLLILGLVALMVIAIAAYLYREYSRDMRDAAQRVTFVTQVSHELKTPLTNIRLYAELLEGKLPTDQPKPRRHIQVIVSESQRLSRLINNILTFARQSRSALKLRPTSVSVAETLGRIQEQFRPSLEAKGFQVEVHEGADTPALADPDALEQILGNLLSNVKKYASQGQWVCMRSGVDEEGQIFVEVEDRGPGIEKSLQADVFQPFVRGSDELSEGVSGTGIGLTIARDLAWMQGGDLTLISGKQGACFRLTLPPASRA